MVREGVDHGEDVGYLFATEMACFLAFFHVDYLDLSLAWRLSQHLIHQEARGGEVDVLALLVETELVGDGATPGLVVAGHQLGVSRAQELGDS